MFELTPYERRHQRALFNPFRDMENFEKNFWGDMAAADFKTDIKDNGKEYVLEAELPGFKKELRCLVRQDRRHHRRIQGRRSDPDDAQERRKRADIEKDRDRLIKSKRPRREYPLGFCVFICAFYKSYFIPCFFI